ncbi:MAG: CheR family methyltransferase [Spirochaetota bacterium]
MIISINREIMARLADVISERTGLCFPSERWTDLERGLRSAMPELGFSGLTEMYKWLLTADPVRRETEILASHLTIGETYFFRDRAFFNSLRNTVIPELVDAKIKTSRSLRIWSAGCCTGEEPYSVAIMLREIIPDISEWNITLLATDINRRFLNKAINGIYNQWSFRQTSDDVRERFFVNAGNNLFSINNEIVSMVKFSILNLVEDVYPSLLNNTNAMDLIICRNVLMYLKAGQAAEVVRRLYNSLVSRGLLSISPVEHSAAIAEYFDAENIDGVTLYRKALNVRQKAVNTQKPETEKHESWHNHISEVKHPEIQAVTTVIKETESQDESESIPDKWSEAGTLYNSGDYTGAIGILTQLEKQGRAEAREMALLASCYANRGMLADARSWCEAAIVRDKLNPRLYYLLSVILHEQGETEQAETAFRKTLYLDPEFALAFFALGNIAAQKGDFKTAEKHYRIVLELLKKFNPEDIIPGSEGMQVGKLSEIIRDLINR